MRRLVLTALLVAACDPGPVADDATDTDVDSDPEEIVDLVTPLGPTEVRAGRISDPASLFGGLGAEARVGDFLLINDRVRFIVQDLGRASGGLIAQGGGVIDADRVRSDGTADADLVVDWMPALDVGWLPTPTRVELVDSGITSGRAQVRVTATDSSFAYLDGVFEQPDRNPSRGLQMITTYTLEPGSVLMEVETELRAGDAEVTTRPGDILQSFPGVTSPWVQGEGRVSVPGAAVDSVMLVHNHHHTTLGLFADDADGSAEPESALDLLNFLVSFTSLYETSGTVPAGGSRTWRRWWGVGRDPAELIDAWSAKVGRSVKRVEAIVDTEQPPIRVEGARVTALVDGKPWSMAITDDDGHVAMDVPATGTITLVADGSGDRLHVPLPFGAGDVSPLAHPDAQAASLASIRDGAEGTPHARGWGRATGEPGTLTFQSAQGRLRVNSPVTDAFEVRVTAVDQVQPDDGLGLPLPDGFAALAYAHDSSIELPLEPGIYDVRVWSGLHYGVHNERVTVFGGQLTEVVAGGVGKQWTLPGWYFADTHVHAIPSFDGKISPSHRALLEVAVGVDIWIASEHDVAVDHRALVDALGLADRLHVVPSVELTPWLRGHFNLFPVVADPGLRAGGAWAWWENLASTTQAMLDGARAQHPDALVQINHPFSPGMPSLAGWSPGKVARPDLWVDDVDAIEVIVPGEDRKGLDLYVDLAQRGVHLAATGSTDSHSQLDNANGRLGTWVYVPEAANAGEIDDADLVAAFQARHTVATNGPLLVVDPLPGSTINSGTTITVKVYTPAWLPVDRVVLYRNGTRETVRDLPPSGELSFEIEGEDDEALTFVAESDTPATGIGGRPAWAVASAILLDASGDGWEAPGAPLVP